MADCAGNINPNPDDLVEITLQTAKSARQFGIDTKNCLVVLNSSFGSAKEIALQK